MAMKVKLFSQRLSLTHGLWLVISTGLCACGGGTYGTGGEDGEASIRLKRANSRQESSEPVSGLLVRVAGTDDEFYSDGDGIAIISYRSTYPLVPIQIEDADAHRIVYYVSTEELSTSEPYEIEILSNSGSNDFAADVAGDTSSESSSADDIATIPEDTSEDSPQCEANINSWKNAIRSSNDGLSEPQRNAIQQRISASQSTIDCAATLHAIEAIAFEERILDEQ
jgi:hypothetical protein